LTFDIESKEDLAGRRIAIETAAADDLGRVRDFAFAGTLVVSNKPRQP
jgi:hypothetical protein